MLPSTPARFEPPETWLARRAALLLPHLLPPYPGLPALLARAVCCPPSDADQDYQGVAHGEAILSRGQVATRYPKSSGYWVCPPFPNLYHNPYRSRMANCRPAS